MIELRTLGVVDLRNGEGVELRSVLVQPKRTAFLAYLAVAAPRGFHRRDALLALFWPEQDAHHARLALRQALHGLRRELGDGVVTVRGDDEVGLDRAQCRCDVWAFERALEAGNLENAVGLYGGPFLEGFFIGGAPEFERWVEVERDRLSRRYAAALEALAQDADRAGNRTGSVEWWSRLAEHSPYTSRVAVGLMRALDAAGDCAGAIRHAQQHTSRLRADLDAGPDPEVERLAADLRSRPSIRESPNVAPAPPPARPSRPVEASDAARPRSAVRLTALLAGLLVLGLAGREVLRRDEISITTSDIRPVTSEPGLELQPTLSPDGKEVALVAGRRRRLIVQSTVAATGPGELLTDTTLGTAWLPKWSPDGGAVRFLACPRGSSPWTADCDWKEIGRQGGTVRSLTVPRHAWTAAWSPDGARIAFSSHDSVFSFNTDDRQTTLLAFHADHPVGLHSLAWSPDARRLAYVHGNVQWLGGGNVLGSSIWVVDAAGGGPVEVAGDEFLNVSPAWLDSRRLLFVSNRDGPRGIYILEVGPRGAHGEPRSVLAASDVHSIAYSPAGHRLAYAKLALRQNIWSYPLDQAAPTPIRDGRRVTNGNQVIEEHDVSPDGRWIAYDNNLGGDANIYKAPLGGGAPVQLTNEPGDELGPRWSADGSEIVFYGARRELLVIPAEGGAAVPLTVGRGSGVNPRWSPNGLQLAFSPGGIGPRGLRIMARGYVGGPWREPVDLKDVRCQPGFWTRDGSGVLCSDNQSTLTVVSPSGRVLWRRELPSRYGLRLQGYGPGYSRDGHTIFVIAARDDGTRGIWGIPVAAGTPRLVVSSGDPALSFFGTVSVGLNQLYATVSEYESDVWAMLLRW